MPHYRRAQWVDDLIVELQDAKYGLDKEYGDAEDEISSAIQHLEVAVKILNAPEEDDLPPTINSREE